MGAVHRRRGGKKVFPWVFYLTSAFFCSVFQVTAARMRPQAWESWPTGWVTLGPVAVAGRVPGTVI